MGRFQEGFKAMLPVAPGIIPFGLIMGSVAQNADLSAFQTFGMNSFVFAGASQLASINLMKENTHFLIIALTGIIINLRFVLYSASLAPVMKSQNLFVKSLASYLLTDQSYAVLMAHDSSLPGIKEKSSFFFGSCLSMMIFWKSSVVLGFYFGNIIPREFSLDFAVPLSFMALSIPSLKTKAHWMVAVFSSVISVILFRVPFNLGLIMTAVLGVSLGWLIRKKNA